MKITVMAPKEITVTHVKICLPVRYGEEDIPNDFPMRTGDIWQATVEIDTGRIIDWPINPRFQDCDLYMKVCDEGSYTLYSHFGDHWDKVTSIESDYVPHGLIPGKYGDYVDLQIRSGVIQNWPKKPDVSAFFSKNEED